MTRSLPVAANLDRPPPRPVPPGDIFLATASGRRLHLVTPRPDEVSVRDVAEALSRIPRFGGHTSGAAYSVARHSIFCARIVARVTPHARLAALLHDAHEAYIGDIATPVQWAIGAMAAESVADLGADAVEQDQVERLVREAVERLKARIQAAIHEAVGLVWPLDDATAEAVRHADRVALMTERRDLLAEGPGRDWGPYLATLPAPWPHPVRARAAPAGDACEFLAELEIELAALGRGMPS